MKKRILALAMLATIASAPVVARAEYKPDWESIGIENAWARSAGILASDEVVSISRQENESEYEYYNRIRELLLSEFTLVSNVPTSTEEAIAMGQNKQLSGDMLIDYMVSVIQERSDIHCIVSYMKVTGSLSNSSTNRSTEMLNAFGKTQTVRSEIIRCVCDETWREKGVYGAIKLDGSLYAIRIGTDASDWATLIPYTDLSCKNCKFDLTWGDTAVAGYRGAGRSTYGKYPLEVYDSDGSYDYLKMSKTKSEWEVQGIAGYYCKNGVITPMTKALHDTLPNNEGLMLLDGIGFMTGEVKRFIE